MNAIDLTGQRFGRLTAKHIVPKEQLPWKKKERAWLCECDCGNQIIVRQRNLRSARFTKSCGCLRKLDAFLATSHVKGLTEEFLYSFKDFDKFLLIHKQLRRYISMENININEYEDYMNYFYNDKQFNCVYDYWKKQNRDSTFYDWYKPSIDHIAPKSRGGTNNKDNLQFLTVFENLSKRDMTKQEWDNFKLKTNTHSELFIEEIMKKAGDANE